MALSFWAVLSATFLETPVTFLLLPGLLCRTRVPSLVYLVFVLHCYLFPILCPGGSISYADSKPASYHFLSSQHPMASSLLHGSIIKCSKSPTLVSSASPSSGETVILYQQFFLSMISPFTPTSTLQLWLLLLFHLFVCLRLNPQQ